MFKIRLLITGFLTGILGAYLGIGGGVILVPALTMFFGYPVKKAVGTSLAVLSVPALTGLVIYLSSKGVSLNLIITFLVTAGAVFGARYGVFLSRRIKSTHIKVFFAGLLLYTGIKQLGLTSFPGDGYTVLNGNYLYFIFLGIIAGLLSALLGVGGGFIIVPALNMLFGFSMHESIVISLSVIVPVSVIGMIFHARVGNVEAEPLKYIIPAAILGAVTGAFLSRATSPQILHGVFGGVLLILAIKMLYVVFKPLAEKK